MRPPTGTTWRFAAALCLVMGSRTLQGATTLALDPSFGAGGIVRVGDSPFHTTHGLALTPDGHILVGGTLRAPGVGATALVVFQYDSNGVLDETFGDAGKAAFTFFLPNGSIAPSRPTHLVRRSDGSIILSGNAFLPNFDTGLMGRLTEQGAVDSGFGAAGKVVMPLPDSAPYLLSGLFVQPSGRIVVVGSTYGTEFLTRCALLGYTAEGAQDPLFGTLGMVISPHGSCASAAQTTDERVVVAGSPGFRVARFDRDGALDPSFGTGGVQQVLQAEVSTVPLAIFARPDGRILIGGARKLDNPPGGQATLVQLTEDGRLDPDFGEGGVTTIVPGIGTSAIRALAVLPSGVIVAGGDITPGGETVGLVFRFRSDGNPDNQFGEGGVVKLDLNASGNDSVREVLVQPDGRILTLGLFNLLSRFDVVEVTSTTTTTSTTSTTSTSTTDTSPSTSVTTSTVVAGTSTTTTLPCTSARCTVEAALQSAACASETIPLAITKKLARVVELVETPANTPKQGRRLTARAKVLLNQAARATLRATKGKRPKISPTCADAIRQGIEGVRTTLGV